MGLRGEVLRGVAGSFVKSWGSQVFGSAFFLVLLYLLEPSDFGLLAMAGVFIGAGEIFADLGLVEAMVQKHSISHAGFSGVFWLLMVLAILTCGLIWLLYPVLDTLTGISGVGSVSSILCLSYLFANAGNVFRARLKRDLSFNRLALCSVSATIVAGGVAIFLAYAGWGVWSLVAREIIYDAVEAGGMAVAADWLPGFLISYDETRELVSFGGKVIGNRAANFFQTRADDFVIGLYLGPSLLGLYSVGYDMFLLLHRLFNQTLSEVALPAFSRIQDNLERVRKNFFRVIRVNSAMGGLIYGLVIIFGADAVRLLLESKWQESGSILQLLAVAGFVHAISASNGPLLFSLGHPFKKMTLSWINAIFNMAAFAIGASYGITGVAIAFVVSEYLYAPVPYGVIKQITNLQWNDLIQSLIPSLLGVLILLASVGALRFYVFSSPGYLLSIGGILLGSLVYCAFFRIVFETRWDECVSIVFEAGRTIRKR